MKKLVFGLIATVMFSFVGRSQECLTLDLSSKISDELKISPDDKHDLTTIAEFNKEKDGTVIVVGYQDKDVVKIASVRIVYNSQQSFKTASLSLAADGCPSGYRSCARGCTNNATESGVLLCTMYCMIDCLGL